MAGPTLTFRGYLSLHSCVLFGSLIWEDGQVLGPVTVYNSVIDALITVQVTAGNGPVNLTLVGNTFLTPQNPIVVKTVGALVANLTTGNNNSIPPASTLYTPAAWVLAPPFTVA